MSKSLKPPKAGARFREPGFVFRGLSEGKNSADQKHDTALKDLLEYGRDRAALDYAAILNRSIRAWKRSLKRKKKPR